jgi:hypothetical protein
LIFLWNKFVRFCQCLPWRTPMTGSRLLVPGAASRRGVGPAGVGVSASLPSRWSFAGGRSRPDPAQCARLQEIRRNLHDRIAEAEREGWLGEVEGLKVSLAGTDDKLGRTSARSPDGAGSGATTTPR